MKKKRRKGKRVEEVEEEIPDYHQRKLVFAGMGNGEWEAGIITKAEERFPNVWNMIYLCDIEKKETLVEKYKDFEDRVKNMRKKGAIVEFGMDITQMQMADVSEMSMVVFNAPLAREETEEENTPLLVDKFIKTMIENKVSTMVLGIPNYKEGQSEKYAKYYNLYSNLEIARNSTYRLRIFAIGAPQLKWMGYKPPVPSDEAGYEEYEGFYYFVMEKNPELIDEFRRFLKDGSVESKPLVDSVGWMETRMPILDKNFYVYLLKKIKLWNKQQEK